MSRSAVYRAAAAGHLPTLRFGRVEPSRRTIAGFLTDEWLPAVAAQGRRPGTVANYRIHLTAHIIPALGGIPGSG
jgi:hypothetical protein